MRRKILEENGKQFACLLLLDGVLLHRSVALMMDFVKLLYFFFACNELIVGKNKNREKTKDVNFHTKIVIQRAGFSKKISKGFEQ